MQSCRFYFSKTLSSKEFLLRQSDRALHLLGVCSETSPQGSGAFSSKWNTASELLEIQESNWEDVNCFPRWGVSRFSDAFLILTGVGGVVPLALRNWACNSKKVRFSFLKEPAIKFYWYMQMQEKIKDSRQGV